MLRLSKSENTFVRIFIIFSFTAYVIFLYGQIISNATPTFLNNLASLKIRWRHILLLLSLIIIAIQFLFWKKKEAMLKFINTTTLIFTISLIITNLFSYKLYDFSYKLPIVKRTVSNVPNKVKPIVLIVLDEYQGIPFKANNRIIGNNILANYLNKEGWEVRRKFKTHEISTIYSISSLFNFNLSENSEFSEIPFFTADNLLRNSFLVKNLENRKITFSNYSFFNIGGLNKWSQLHLIPDSFLDLFFEFSVLPLIKMNIISIKSGNKRNIDFATSIYNSQLLEKSNFVLNNKNLSGLTYIHFFMPHSPYHFQDKINLYEVNTSNYYLYWNFCNNKIIHMLQDSNYQNRLKIIITGDHGFRSDPQINPYNTFSAFYGFEKNEIDQLKSVQDIGKLIADNF